MGTSAKLQPSLVVLPVSADGAEADSLAVPTLPVPPTPLIGRAVEVAAVRALFAQPEVRCITLTGAPGIGKTRLALEVASAGGFADGVVFLSLAPIRDPGLVMSAIARAVRAKGASGRPPLERVQAALLRKAMLLVLDNFEQVLGAAPLVAELLTACPTVKALVTSRAVLHLRGEYEFVVPPLALPDPARLPAVETLARYEAVALFLQLARAIAPDFRLTAENARAVAEICVRLDGLPLAIELAVPRLKLFSPQALQTRMAHRLAWLTDGPQDLPSRQQTLRNAIVWSDELLSPFARALFRALSVFVGGWTLDAAEMVGAVVADAPSSPACGVADGLTALINQSLVRHETPAPHEPRFGMLETVREYGAEQLLASGAEDAARRAHARYYVTLAERIEPHLYDADQAVWMESVEREHDNIRAALAWLLAHDEIGMALRLSGCLQNFWIVHDHFSEGQRWLEMILARSTQAPPMQRIKALRGAAVLALRRGDYAHAGAWREESLALCREIGDPQLIAESLLTLGSVAAVQGESDRATALFAESLTLARSVNDRRTIAHALSQIGEVARLHGDDARAVGLYEESLALWRAMGETERVAMVLHNLGPVVYRQGDPRRAAVLLAESLALSWELRNTHGSAICLVGIAGVIGARGKAVAAARLLGAAEALRTAIGVQWEPVDRSEFDRSVATVRMHLDAETLAAVWEEGSALTLEQAVSAALATLPQSGNTLPLPRRAPDRANTADGGLTRREREVVSAVARGMTNREIADALFIAEKTVEMHVSNSLSKLGFRARAQLAAWAVVRPTEER
ncbi:MAG TPA: LuxR C-terminal-related transcriptional regulator [Thermomicrobiales bacterium]